MNLIWTSSYFNCAMAPLLRSGLNLTPLASTVRFRSRPSTRAKRDAKHARMKALRASQPPPERKLSFMQKVIVQLMKGREDQSVKKNVSLALAFPSRILKVEGVTPEDDVFRMSMFDHTIPLSSALAMLRQLNDKTIYDDPKAAVNLRLDLNMSLDLEAKEYIENFKQMIVLPYPFEFGKRRVVMAFSKQTDAQMAAREAGAEFAGGEDVIRKIKRGEFKIDEVDYFVANLDLVQELTTIRGLLRDKAPSHTNGLLGLDVIPLVKHFRNAITLEIKRDELNPAWGICSTLIGRLDMTDQQLESNAAFLIKRLCENRPLALSLGHFIHRAAVVVPERKTFYQWDFTPMAPLIPNDDSALQAMADKESGKKVKKRKKK